MRKYYEAYDDRYRQVHGQKLQWASNEASAIVLHIIRRHSIGKESAILEIGCGEGRDASALLEQGYCLTATDISPEAIRYCREKWPEQEDSFQILDCIRGQWKDTYDYIYAVAVIHMLVEDEDRAGFYRFIRQHLREKGIALVCTMGDGEMTVKSDISTAFDLQERTHEATGRKLLLSGTSCRMVNREHFLNEIRENGLNILESGLTEVPPDFPVMMYAIVEKS